MKKLLALVLALTLLVMLVTSFVSCTLDDLSTKIDEYSSLIKDKVNEALGDYLRQDPELEAEMNK